MRINQYVQLVAFVLALSLPISLLWSANWGQVLAITAYIWAIGLLAALWDKHTWRKE